MKRYENKIAAISQINIGRSVNESSNNYNDSAIYGTYAPIVITSPKVFELSKTV